MPRKPKSATLTFKEVPIDLGDNITAIIRFPEGKRPRIVWNDNALEVTNGPVMRGRQFLPQYMNEPQEPSETNGPDRDTPEMIAWKARRAGKPADVPRKGDGSVAAPFTTEDAAPGMGLSFEAMSAIAGNIE